MAHCQWRSNRLSDRQVRVVASCPASQFTMFIAHRFPGRVLYGMRRHYLGLHACRVCTDVLPLVACHAQTNLSKPNMLHPSVSSSFSQPCKCRVSRTSSRHRPFSVALHRTRSHPCLPHRSDALLALDLLRTVRWRHVRSGIFSSGGRRRRIRLVCCSNRYRRFRWVSWRDVCIPSCHIYGQDISVRDHLSRRKTHRHSAAFRPSDTIFLPFPLAPLGMVSAVPCTTPRAG